MASLVSTYSRQHRGAVHPRPHTAYLRWIQRISDDMWGAVQLLGLFFLGATILCVPPRYAPPSPPSFYTGVPAATAAAPARPAPALAAAPQLVTASVHPASPAADAPRRARPAGGDGPDGPQAH